MAQDEQERTLEQYRRWQLHFYYVAGTRRYYRPHWDAMFLKSTLSKRRLYRYASAPWEGDNIGLKARLVHATHFWDTLFTSEGQANRECPISFTQEEAEACQRLCTDQQGIDEYMTLFRNMMGISQDGWTSHEGYHHALAENERIKTKLLDGEDEVTRKNVLDHWPFDDHEDYNLAESVDRQRNVGKTEDR